MPASATDSTRPSYMLAIVRAVAALGGSARPQEVYVAIEANGERRYRALGNDVDQRLHYENAVRFARQELADGGTLDRTPGIWTLVDIAAAGGLTIDDAIRIIGENRRERERRRAMKTVDKRSEQALSESETEVRYRMPGPSTGPRPSRYEASVRREDGPASTYVFRFGTSDIWKVGYAGDVRVRLDHVNQHVPVELGEGGWHHVRSARWLSQDPAYAMEQLILRLLVAERTMFERVRCDEAHILAAWDHALSATAAEVVDHQRAEEEKRE